MTRIKLLGISAITAAMILGSGLALAVTPADQADTGTTADQTNISVLDQANPAPTRKMGGGGTGRALKK